MKVLDSPYRIVLQRLSKIPQHDEIPDYSLGTFFQNEQSQPKCTDNKETFLSFAQKLEFLK